MSCWMNGHYVKSEEIKISPFDHGFLYGVGFFETFRTYDGHVFLFKEHMERLRGALAEYRIAMPYEDAEILEAIQMLTDKEDGEDGYFRLNISGGVHDIGLAPASYQTPNVILFRKKLALTVLGAEKSAVWLETARNNPESTVRHKSHNYLNNVRGRLELSSLKEKEGLFVTAEGFVAEGVTSNVFWLKNGILFTPAIATGILPGTTRASIIELAIAEGITVNEGFYSKRDVENSDELFVTNSVQELVPLASIEEVILPGAQGLYYKKLHKLYSEEIENMKEGNE